MKKKKNAFTLIELLAIIVILAIIAVITVPIILNIIENSRKGAATDSAYGFKDSVNKYYITKLSEDRQFQLEGPYNVSDGYISGANITGSVEIPTSGTKPSSGTLNYSNNVLTSGCLVIGDYAVRFGENGSVTDTSKGDCKTRYTVTFISGEETVKTQTIIASEGSQKAVAPSITNGNKTLSGWYTDSGFSTEFDLNNDVTSNLTLYAKWTTPLSIGDTVNYITTLNNVTLDNWKVFYTEGNYTYLIYGDYLPNTAISSNLKSIHNLEPYGEYAINPNNSRDDFISFMTTTSKWLDLINNGSLNENSLSTEVKSDANVWAMGSPTIDLWVNSWNTKYPSDTIYIRYINTDDIDYENFYAIGYAIGDSASLTTTKISLSSKTGYNNTLYFPYHTDVDSQQCWGYWFASISASYDTSVMSVGLDDIHGSGEYGEYDIDFALRPVIKLPTSLFE